MTMTWQTTLYRGAFLALGIGQLIDPGCAQETETDIFQYIDPLIGTTNGGHVFPGATLPFGMAKAVADVSSGEAQGGYASDDSSSTCDSTVSQNLGLLVKTG